MHTFVRGLAWQAAAVAAAVFFLIPTGLLLDHARAGWDTEPCIDWPGGERETFAVFDTLFLERDNASNNVPLIINGDTNTTVFAAPDLQFATAPGVRATLGEHGPQVVGWEVGLRNNARRQQDALAWRRKSRPGKAVVVSRSGAGAGIARSVHFTTTGQPPVPPRR